MNAQKDLSKAKRFFDERRKRAKELKALGEKGLGYLLPRALNSLQSIARHRTQIWLQNTFGPGEAAFADS